MGWNGTEWGGMGQDGVEWDRMGQDGVGFIHTLSQTRSSSNCHI